MVASVAGALSIGYAAARSWDNRCPPMTRGRNGSIVLHCGEESRVEVREVGGYVTVWCSACAVELDEG